MKPPDYFKACSRFSMYAVNSYGTVVNMRTGLVKKASRAGANYLAVHLYLDGKGHTTYVHHLVAEAFIGERPAGLEINHKDGDKKNNRADNLEYVTASDNSKHAYRLGLKNATGSNNGRAKLNWSDVEEIRSLENKTKSCPELALLYGVSASTISGVRVGSVWSKK